MSDSVTRQAAQEAVRTLLEYIEPNGEYSREGLANTPLRVVNSYDELFSGYDVDAKSVLESKFNAEGYDGIVLLRDIEFHSTCEHHILPFSGRAHVAYIPTDLIVGISKLARLVEVHSRRLQNQERITKCIADDIEENLAPLGCAVIIEASHHCMGCRGARKPHSVMTTSAMRGVFFDKSEARTELMQLIRSSPLNK